MAIAHQLYQEARYDSYDFSQAEMSGIATDAASGLTTVKYGVIYMEDNSLRQQRSEQTLIQRFELIYFVGPVEVLFDHSSGVLAHLL